MLLTTMPIISQHVSAQTPQQMEYERQQREYRLQMERQQQEQQRQQQLMNENARRQQEESRRLNTNPGSGAGSQSGMPSYATPTPGAAARQRIISTLRATHGRRSQRCPQQNPLRRKVDSARIDAGQIIRSVRSACCDGQGRPVRRLVRWRHVRIPH